MFGWKHNLLYHLRLFPKFFQITERANLGIMAIWSAITPFDGLLTDLLIRTPDQAASYMVSLFVLCFAIFLVPAWSSAYKMVLFVPDMANSQVIFNARVAETLAKAGHDVTMVMITSYNDRDSSDVKIMKDVKIHSINASCGRTKKELEEQQQKIIFKWQSDGFCSVSHGSAENPKLCCSQADTGNVIIVAYICKEKNWVEAVIMESTDEMNFVERTKSFIGHAILPGIWKKWVMVNSNELFELPRPTLAKIVNIGGVGIQMKDAKPLNKEAVTSGVPMITVALFGDQPRNVKLAERHHFAISIRKGDVSVNAIAEALDKLLKDKSYSQNVKRLSQMVKKKPVSADHLVVAWSEFAAEFKTLENLVPAGTKLNFVQYHSLDANVHEVMVSKVFLTVLLTAEKSKLAKKVLFNARVAETLAKAGHDVTMVMITAYNDRDSSDVKIMKDVKKVVKNKGFLDWLVAQKFDLAFTHIYDVCPIGLIHYAKIPSWIWLNSGILMDYVAHHMGVPTIPSYVPRKKDDELYGKIPTFDYNSKRELVFQPKG
ncbi:UDP-glucoronosyl and UDP-glucosyl transferase [Teladorsagia circumcincta]|uniref:glucuronosyltransferase n=1 Tax=Teladorsagia circumcincta TaxID=45464 RepID=A0A2G9UQL2_TELCI|nr:UDP-glucoronosyl and UDP-glucosyl transferase [Teladorsagia circumcincta]